MIASAVDDGRREEHRQYVERMKARTKEFAAKLRIVCEETDETQYWIELLTESGIMRESQLRDLHTECTELLAIFTTALSTTRQKLCKK